MNKEIVAKIPTFLIIVIVILMILSYLNFTNIDKFKSNISNDSRVIKEIDSNLQHLDNKISFLITENQKYKKNLQYLNNLVCGSCHLKPQMLLPISNLSKIEFINYVRGSNRSLDNSIMPNFDESLISEIELNRLYNHLF